MPKLINKNQKKTFLYKKFCIPAEYYNILIGVCSRVEAQPYINRKSLEKIIFMLKKMKFTTALSTQN